jgi:hypothetical protein
MNRETGGHRPKASGPDATGPRAAERAHTSDRGLLSGTKAADVGLGLALRPLLDARAAAEVREGFDKIAAGRDVMPLTVENLVAAMGVVSEAMRLVTRDVIGRIGTGELLVSNHPVIEMLDQGIDALADLGRGKTHNVLKAASHRASAALTTEERKRDETLLEAIVIAQSKYGFRTFVQAARFVAKGLRALGRTRDGLPITTVMLTQIKDYSRKRNRSKRYSRK